MTTGGLDQFIVTFFVLRLKNPNRNKQNPSTVQKASQLCLLFNNLCHFVFAQWVQGFFLCCSSAAGTFWSSKGFISRLLSQAPLPRLDPQIQLGNKRRKSFSLDTIKIKSNSETSYIRLLSNRILRTD